MITDTFTLTIHMVSSLDGIIAKEDNSTSWFDTTDVYEQGATLTPQQTEDFLKTIDCYIMGSRTYEHALELSKQYGWAYGDVPTIVLTHRNLQALKPNIEFYSGDLEKLVNERLKPNYKNVWLVGGPTLAKEAICSNLATGIRLSVMPIILGAGKQFFDHIGQEHPLHLKNVTAYKNGIVELHYEINKTAEHN
ncbi:MAG: dihydrofolate reductase [Bacteroidetes bacterium]|nr:dihydrofolate reductase [Bacteroidota bacterium]